MKNASIALFLWVWSLSAIAADPIDGLGLGSITARAQRGNIIYVAPESGGIAVVDAGDPEHPKVVDRLAIDRSFSRLLVDGSSLVALETHEVATTFHLADPLHPLTGRKARADPAAIATVSTPAPALSVVARPSAVVARVIDLKDGRVIFDAGQSSGLSKGSHVRVISQKLVRKPDLTGQGTVESPSGEITAIVAIEQAETDRSMALLGRGDIASLGDLIEVTDEPLSERLALPRRAPFTARVGFHARPFLGLEGTKKPVGFLIDAFGFYYFDSIPMAVGVQLSPLGFALNTQEAHYPMTVAATATYATDYFEIGLGLGALFGNPGPCFGTFPETLRSCEVNNGLTINQTLRLGALDGVHFEWHSSIFSRPDNFVFGMGRGEIAVPITSRLGLFGGGGAGENGWLLGELGVRTYVGGAGAPGTIILSASLGAGAVFDGPSREYVVGPSVAFGAEWRL